MVGPSPNAKPVFRADTGQPSQAAGLFSKVTSVPGKSSFDPYPVTLRSLVAAVGTVVGGGSRPVRLGQ